GRAWGGRRVAHGPRPPRPAPGPRARLPGRGRAPARVLGRVRGVLGRDAARPSPARAQHGGLLADPASHRPADRRRRAVRPLPSRRSGTRGRGRARSRRRPVAAAHVRSRRVRRGRGGPLLRRRARPLSRQGATMNADARAQERARAYFASKAALSPEEIREQIVAAFDALDAVLTTIPAERAARRPTPEQWSVQEIADHLLETYRPGVDRLRRVLACQRPLGEPVPAARQSKAPRLRRWSWLLDELRRAHRDVVELIGGVKPDFVTEARVPIVMVVNVPGDDATERALHWVEDLDWKAYA